MRNITKSTNSIVKGSLSDIAKINNQSLAETFMQCDVVILVDTSGSMSIQDSRDDQSRYNVACNELRALQNNLPGKIAVISFSSDVEFCPSGVPTFQGGGTDMAKALKLAKIADGIKGMRFILISDGEPDRIEETLAIAKIYQNKIDTIYVGPTDRPSGNDFLQRLASASGGQTITADRAKELKASIETMLLKAG